jgi:hypothetical protein
MMFARRKRGSLLGSAAVLTFSLSARAQSWTGAASAGGDVWLTPETFGHGFVLFDLRGRGVIGRGDFHALFNTDTLHVAVENVPLGRTPFQFSAAVRGEALIAGVLSDYVRDNRRVPERGFYASYVYSYASLKWLPGGPHSVEVLAAGRRWFFGRQGATSANLVLPPDAWVFEPRLRYTFWRVTSPGAEWDAHILFPRVTGFAAGVELGLDLRSDTSPWGSVGAVTDTRNRPGDVIFSARQWLRAGAQLTPRVRVQLDENASWGEGEDDLTRVRVGGMNPYVVPVPGLAWPALLCERLLAGQVSVHVRPSLRHGHEFGALVAGGVFNDVRRTGGLDTFDAGGGVAAFGDLRFGRFQAYLRAGWAFPTAWLQEPPHFSALVALGAKVF